MLGEQAKSPKRSSFAITPPVTPRRNLSFWLRRKTIISTNRTYRAYGLAPFRKGRIVAGRIAIACAHARRSSLVCSEGISLIIIKNEGVELEVVFDNYAHAHIRYIGRAGARARAHAQYKSHVYYVYDRHIVHAHSCSTTTGGISKRLGAAQKQS